MTNNPKRKNQTRVKQLATGQVWQMSKSELHVKEVGKLLVHYKLFRKNVGKSATSISTMKAVENFLALNKATLIHEQAMPAVK
jgi:hypothetical protein